MQTEIELIETFCHIVINFAKGTGRSEEQSLQSISYQIGKQKATDVIHALELLRAKVIEYAPV